MNHGLRKMKDTCASKTKKQMIDLNDIFHGWEKIASRWKNSRIGIVKVPGGRRESLLTLAQATAAAWDAADVREEREAFREKTSVQLPLAFSNFGV
jgi:hypothetical protein